VSELILTDEEIREVTGHRAKEKQYRWCLMNHIACFKSGNDSLVISRQHFVDAFERERIIRTFAGAQNSHFVH